jgi:hypothetical protein
LRVGKAGRWLADAFRARKGHEQPGPRRRWGKKYPVARGQMLMRGEDLTLLRSSSCCCSNSGTAAMATRASSRSRLAVRGKKRLDRRRRRGLGTPPPSQQPREQASSEPRAPPERPPPSPLPSILEPGKEARRAYPRSARRSVDRRTAAQTRGHRTSLTHARLKKERALGQGNLLLSPSPRWRRAVT